MPMSKCRKRPWNLYKFKNSFWKRTLFLDHRVRNVPQVSSETSLPWLVQNKPSTPIRRVETRLNSSKDNFIAKSFRLSTKRKLSILLNFLFPFVSFIGVFSILKCKTFVLETTTSWSRASHFVDRWHLQRCQIRFFPHPLNGWHDRIFFFQIYLHAFFLSKSVCRTFSLNSKITPSKVKWSAPKIHQTFGQLTDSDLSIISKGFWNNRGQKLSRGGGRNSFLLTPTRKVRTDVRTYVDAITKFSRMDSLPSLKFIRLLRVVFSSQQRRYWGSNNDSK